MQKGGDKLGYESEAFAIYDTMKYIKPEVHTLCVGTAFGESAMLLAAGTPVGLLSDIDLAMFFCDEDWTTHIVADRDSHATRNCSEIL